MAQQLTTASSIGSGVVGTRRPIRLRAHLLGTAIAFVILVGWTLLAGMTEREGFPSPIWHFAFAVGWAGVPVAYPFIVLLPVVLPLSQEMQKRWIFYTRSRVPIRAYLVRLAWRNVWLVFALFFAYVVLVFAVFYYGGSLLGIDYDPSALVMAPGERLARLTTLLDIHPMVYAVVYATWHGLNAAIWATVGFVALLLIRQRILALTVPFAIFAVLSILMGIAGPPWSWNTPWLLWVLFSVSDVPFAPSIMLLASFVAVVAAAASVTIRRADRLNGMQ